MKKFIVFLTCIPLLLSESRAQENLHIRVHFLFGSKPRHQFKKQEPKWFGGKLGGHTGIEIAPNHIIDFGPRENSIFSRIKKKDTVVIPRTIR